MRPITSRMCFNRNSILLFLIIPSSSAAFFLYLFFLSHFRSHSCVEPVIRVYYLIYLAIIGLDVVHNARCVDFRFLNNFSIPFIRAPDFPCVCAVRIHLDTNLYM